MNPRTQPTPDEQKADIASSHEARQAIHDLSNADLVKLMLIARRFTRIRIRGSVVEPEDLLQEAITKTLAGQRAWNRSVSMVKHLDRVMESDAGHIAERQASHRPGALPKEADEPTTITADPSFSLGAQDEVDDLLRLFRDDQEVL